MYAVFPFYSLRIHPDAKQTEKIVQIHFYGNGTQSITPTPIATMP